MDADAGTLIPTDKRNSLIAWFNLYMGIEAGDQDSNTFKAKQSDLSRFINYFRRVTGSDHPDQWTRSVSQGFVKDLLRAKSDRTGKKLAPTTVNRVLATLRNTARWIHHQRAFLAGYPMERISDVSIPEPEWRGLARRGCHQAQGRRRAARPYPTRVSDQNAVRDQAILLVMLDTAFRVSELVSLDLEQYEGKHFTERQAEGKSRHRPRVRRSGGPGGPRPVHRARSAERAAGPLFQSKRGRRLAPQNIADALDRIVAQANTQAFGAGADPPHPARASPHGTSEDGREEGHPLRPADGRPRLDQVHLAIRPALPKRDGRGGGGAVRLNHIPHARQASACTSKGTFRHATWCHECQGLSGRQLRPSLPTVRRLPAVAFA